MISNNSNIPEIFKETNIPNEQRSNINYKENDNEKEKEDLKNLRIETSLSLRKKKLNDYLFSKRKKEILPKKNENSIEEENLSLNYNEIKKNIPPLLLEEFDFFENKLLVFHQFLTNDFTMLHGMNCSEKYLKQFIFYKLHKLTYDESPEIFGEKFKNDLNLVFYDLIKMLKEYNDKNMIYAISIVIVNFIYCSSMLVEEFRKANIWRRLAEVTELKDPEINENIVIILSNLYSVDPNYGKEYILSNYSRYIKQIMTNYFKTFIDNSKKEKIDLKDYLSALSLIKRLLNQENKKMNKNNEFDVVVKMKYIYDDLSKMFSISVSWILNNVINPNHDLILKLLLILLNLFSLIITYSDEETYEMQDFRSESFVNSFCSLLNYLISNNEKKVNQELVITIINELYHFIGILCSYNCDKTEMYSKNKIITITLEYIKNMNIMSNDLGNKIIFFLSNYAENESRIKEIVETCNMLPYIKDFYKKNINNDKICYNIFCLINNIFINGNNNCKDLIISNFSNFLVERIKILSDTINEKELFKIKCFVEKCKLLWHFILYLKKNNLQLLNNLLEYIRLSNIEQMCNNVELMIKGEQGKDKDKDKENHKQQKSLELFIDEIKNK